MDGVFLEDGDGGVAGPEKRSLYAKSTWMRSRGWTLRDGDVVMELLEEGVCWMFYTLS